MLSLGYVVAFFLGFACALACAWLVDLARE